MFCGQSQCLEIAGLTLAAESLGGITFRSAATRSSLTLILGAAATSVFVFLCRELVAIGELVSYVKDLLTAGHLFAAFYR